MHFSTDLQNFAFLFLEGPLNVSQVDLHRHFFRPLIVSTAPQREIWSQIQLVDLQKSVSIFKCPHFSY